MTHNFCTYVPFLCFYQPVLMQATFTSHHSGIRGRITITLSPCCRPQASERTFAAFLDSTPSSSKLHLTSSPAPSTHHNAGFLDFFPCYRTTRYSTNEAPVYLHSVSLELPIKELFGLLDRTGCGLRDLHAQPARDDHQIIFRT